MSEVVLTMFTTLDGYVAGPGGEFVAPDFSPQVQAEWSDVNVRASYFVYGRTNFEFNAAFWQGMERDENAAPDQRAFAETMHRIPKLVASHTLTEVGWNGRVLRDVPGEITALTEATDDPIVVIGGAGVAQSFLRLSLIDRLRIMVIPLLLGDGLRLFDRDTARTTLERTGCTPLDTGAVILEYRVVR